MTLREAAEKAGIAFTFLGEIERDEKAPSIATLKALAALYELPIGKLLD